MKKKRLFVEGIDKGLVGMNLKEANETKVKMDKPQQIQKNEQIFLKPKKTSEERKKEVDEFGKMLQSGIKEYIKSDRYKEILDNMAKFHEYSVNNSIGIMIQKPDATLVAPYTKWQRLNRQVKKGEKGIVILCPVKYKKMIEKTKLDEAGKPVLDKNGFEIKNKTYQDCIAFKIGFVFDKSQTVQIEGKKELVLEPVNELKESVGQSFSELMHTIQDISPVPVSFEKIQSGVKGYYDDKHVKIVVNQGMSELQTLKTLIHETAHARIHGSHWESDYKKISFDVRECVEFPNLGKVYENVSLEEAVDKLGKFSHSSMLPGLVFRLHDGSDYADMDYPLVVGDELQIDSLNLIEHFRESFEVQKAVVQLTPKFGSVEYLRSTKEIQAESIAYIVSKHFGLDTSDYSFGYVGTWIKDNKQLMDNLDVIKATSNQMINDIELSLNKKILLENGIETKEDMVNKIDGFMKTFDPFNHADNEQFIGFNHDSILRDINNNDIDSIKDFLNQIIDEDMESEMTKEAEKLIQCLDAFVEVILKTEIQDGIKINHGMR
ncbi:ArdC family protein [Holdemanella porci]|uniref:ArdC family protein n=1 Tax=Holdemanella porci TaxID=2652276 RepID=UPI002FD9F1DB